MQHSPYQYNGRFWLIIVIAAVLAIALLIGSCSGSRDQQNKNRPIAVVVSTAYHSNVPVYLTGLGAVTPTYTVTVRTQINGVLMSVLFREGQMVKAGDLLAKIDDRPYQAQLVQYQGQLARDSALLTNALLDLKRYQTLWRQDSVSKQVLDTQAALVQQYRGTVELDKGLIEATKVNLIYCNITSPIDGRIGLRLVDPGNYVQTADVNGIAVLTKLNPITVIFTLPEDNVPAILKQLNAGYTLTAQAYDRTQTTLLATGKLLTIDNQIDSTTGTVKLRAEFDNKNNTLFPSQFVNVKMLLETLPGVTVIPTAAIQRGAKGTFVYVLKDDYTVSIKPIVTGVAHGDDTVVSSGIVPGQRVVVEGADKLTDGAKVTVQGGLPKKSVARHYI